MRRLTKPFLCLLLSLLLAAGGVLPAFAEAGTAGTAEAPLDPATVTLNQPDAKAGENFTISIALSENSGACGIDFTILYDSSKAELISCGKAEELNGLSVPNTEQAGKILYSYANLEPLVTAEPFFTAEFKAKTGIQKGDGAIRLQMDSIFNYDGKEILMKGDGVGASLSEPAKEAEEFNSWLLMVLIGLVVAAGAVLVILLIKKRKQKPADPRQRNA